MVEVSYSDNGGSGLVGGSALGGDGGGLGCGHRLDDTDGDNSPLPGESDKGRSIKSGKAVRLETGKCRHSASISTVYEAVAVNNDGLFKRKPRHLQDLIFSPEAISYTDVFTVQPLIMPPIIKNNPTEKEPGFPWWPWWLTLALILAGIGYGLYKALIKPKPPIEDEEMREMDPESAATETEAPEGEEVEVEEEEKQQQQEEEEEVEEEDEVEEEEEDEEDDKASSSSSSLDGKKNCNQSCKVLLMDHLFMNHEKCCHEALEAFFFDFLACSVDPRKKGNKDSEKKTFFANIGLYQFCLSEGTEAPVFDGVITLVCKDVKVFMKKYKEFLDGAERFTPLKDTDFCVNMAGNKMVVMTPWGNQFVILSSNCPEEDRAEFPSGTLNDDNKAPREDKRIQK